MDEIQKNAQDDNRSSVTGDIERTSGEERESTSGGKPETVTKEELTKLREDAAASIGRAKLASELTVERDSLKQELGDHKMAVDDLNKRIEELENAAVEGDPDLKAKLISDRKAGTKVAAIEAREREVVKKEAQVKADAETVSKSTREATIAGLATEYNVTTEWLSGLGVTDPKALEEIAKASGKKGETAEEKRLRVDSGKTIGGEGWRDLSADDKIRQGTK